MDWERVLGCLAIIAMGVSNFLWNRNRASLHKKELSLKDTEISLLQRFSPENLIDRLNKMRQEMEVMEREYDERQRYLYIRQRKEIYRHV